MGERRRMPGGSGVARDPKAIVGSPGNTPWAKNAKYEYGCYLSIILPSQNNRHNSKICSLIQTHISPLWGCLINLGTRVSRENGIWGGFGCYQKSNSTNICHFLPTGPRRGCQSGPRGGGSRAVEQKRGGRRLSCVPRFLGIAVVCRRLLRRLVELRVVQVGVEAALGEQLVVRALLDDVAVANYQDYVGVADRG